MHQNTGAFVDNNKLEASGGMEILWTGMRNNRGYAHYIIRKNYDH